MRNILALTMQIAKVNKNIEIDSVELPVFDLDSGLEKNSFATSVTVTCFLCTSFFQDNGLNCQFVISYDSIECNLIVILDIQCNVLQTNKNKLRLTNLYSSWK